MCIRDSYRDEIELLANTRSLTFYVPGAPLFGEAHCNMGNPQLIMDTILTWHCLLYTSRCV